MSNDDTLLNISPYCIAVNYGGLLLRRENNGGQLVALYSKSARIGIVGDYWRVNINISIT